VITSEGVGLAAPAIELHQVGKRYRLYQKPLYRFLDLFGMCPASAGYYSEHVALDAIGLTVLRGERVAIIGRNGAGKSTLLKIITGLVRPTSGTVDVNGQVSNLLQIGSGFHPDFTGRQNVFANLAHQGITGVDAARAFEEIVAFAEIEEYIDQPMKTYSTGMCSRLMFSSSVVIKPEILIVDEILGVGDAYFSHKSFERMRELCTRDGATLLLVTHDIYSALNLCDRFVWLDRGVVKFDGEGKAAVALYESSIKEQEEQWLRRQNAEKLATTAPGDERVIHVLVRSQTGFAFPSPLAIDLIELQLGEGSTSALRLANGSDTWQLLAEGNLGEVDTIAGTACRAIRTAGSIYHKAEWRVRLPPRSDLRGAKLRWHYRGNTPADLRVFTNKRQVLVSGTLSGGIGWQEQSFTPTGGGPRELEGVFQTGFGTGLVRINDVRFLDARDHEVVEVRHGERLSIRMSIRVHETVQGQRALFVLGFTRHASPYSALIHDECLCLPHSDSADIVVAIEQVRLGSGTWYVNVGIGEPGLYDKPVMKYFTVDPSWYHVLAARLELKVSSVNKFDASGCFVVHPGVVSVTAMEPRESIDSGEHTSQSR
jgi:ABC-type polysaccharide/polyol phosphate transport system ATPase subunit